MNSKELEALEEIGTTLMFINKNTLESKPLKEVMPNCYNIVEKSLKALEIIKPLCEVVETPVKKYRYLKVNGVVVYTFKTEEEYDLFKEVLEWAD